MKGTIFAIRNVQEGKHHLLTKAKDVSLFRVLTVK